MSVQVEKLEHNMARLTIEVEAEKLDKAILKAFNKQKKDFNMPGFRRGKVPYAMIEKMYGPEIFYEDAANDLINEAYPEAYDTCGESIVSSPQIDLVQIEKGKPFIFTAEVALKPPVTLGEYKGIEVTKADAEVTDEDIDEKIEAERKNNARMIEITDRAVETGDTVDIDFDGFVDGERFEGGKSEGYSLQIGSHSFIDTFEDQLVGKMPGEEVDVNVTFPEDYQAEELSGKNALFKVKINHIKGEELPDVDDDFAMDVSEFDTLEEYRESLRGKVAEEKKASARTAQENEAVAKIAAAAEIDIPDAMIETQTDQLIRDIEQNLASQGISMDLYYQFTGMTRESMREDYRARAEIQIRQMLTMEAIADAESIEVSDEEVDEELRKMAESYGMDPRTLLEVAGEEDRDSIRSDKKLRKATDLVMEYVVEVEPAEEAPAEEVPAEEAPAEETADAADAE